jgi:hypothetical protein
MNTHKGPRLHCTHVTEDIHGSIDLFRTVSKLMMMSQDGSVGIATGFGLDGRGSIPPGQEIFLFTVSRPALGPTHPPVQYAPGALSLGVKRPWREADHSPPSSSEAKNGAAISALPYASSWRDA